MLWRLMLLGANSWQGCMSGTMSVPLEVETGVGNSWAEVH